MVDLGMTGTWRERHRGREKEKKGKRDKILR